MAPRYERQPTEPFFRRSDPGLVSFPGSHLKEVQ